jgi:tetratricopeptide (TPR) repeat protein
MDLSRGFQALKTWFTFKVFGADKIGLIISQTCQLARYLQQQITAQAELEMMAPVQLNIVCFRFRHGTNRVNARIAVELQEGGEVAPSTTIINGILVIRAAIVNHRTTRRELDLLLQRTVEIGQMLVKEPVSAPDTGQDWQPWLAKQAALLQAETQIAATPLSVDLCLKRAALLGELGLIQDARDQYLQVLTMAPSHPTALNSLGTLLYGTGYRTAAHTAYAEAAARHPSDVTSLINLANILLDEGDAAAARQQYAMALHLETANADAHQGMARALTELGDHQQAEIHRRLGYENNSLAVLPYRGRKQPVSLLLLVSAKGGNIPIRHILDDTTFKTFVLTTDYCNQRDPLPAHHVVFNSIGDADLAHKALLAAESVLVRTSAPVLNAPAAVLATGRADNSIRLRNIPLVVTPLTVVLPKQSLQAPDARRTLSLHGFHFPLLVRAPGFHTGRHFFKVDEPQHLDSSLAEIPGNQVTVIQYLDARGRDGKSRKYRVMMIDGRLYPLHVAISSHWKIHYFTAEMAERPDHRAEDEAFLEDMPSILGPPVMRALTAIQNTLGLDYAGIDFGLSQDGQLLLFEANATMVVMPPDPRQQWAYRKPAVDRIHRAVKKMLTCQAIDIGSNEVDSL